MGRIFFDGFPEKKGKRKRDEVWITKKKQIKK